MTDFFGCFGCTRQVRSTLGSGKSIERQHRRDVRFSAMSPLPTGTTNFAIAANMPATAAMYFGGTVETPSGPLQLMVKQNVTGVWPGTICPDAQRACSPRQS